MANQTKIDRPLPLRVCKLVPSEQLKNIPAPETYDPQNIYEAKEEHRTYMNRLSIIQKRKQAKLAL